MATLFNNTEITNAFFNGTELDKIYFNGVLVFEKGGKYLRRIMVGDDLKGKTIYMDSITSKEIQETYDNYGLSIEYYYNIIEAPDFSIRDIYREHWVGISDFPPSYEIETWEGKFIEYDKDLDKITIINNKITVSSDSNKNYIVTSIDRRRDFSSSPVSNDNHKTYRHFYIEDENIRPLKVGDKITENTKFYFNVPDDFYLQAPPPGEYSKDVDVIVLNNDLHKFKLRFWDDKIYTAFYLDTMRAEEGNMYEYNRETSTLVKNISMIVGPHRNYQNMHFEGTVTSVATDSTIYPYILVDTTTLGA